MKRNAALPAIAALLVSSPCLADFGGDSVWIISAGSSAGINIQSGTPQTTVYDINIAVGHSLGESLELMLLGMYGKVNSELNGSRSESEIAGQLNWIALDGHADALYIGPRVGRRATTGLNFPTPTLFFGGAVGKRFSLGSLVSYEPNVSIRFTSTEGEISTPAYHFAPLQFTLIF